MCSKAGFDEKNEILHSTDTHVKIICHSFVSWDKTFVIKVRFF
ncbi:unnamed protein product [Ixodes pacificus]